MKATCEYPRWSPTRENPGGDCGASPAPMAAPLGRTGLHLALCSGCAPHRVDAVPREEVREA